MIRRFDVTKKFYLIARAEYDRRQEEFEMEKLITMLPNNAPRIDCDRHNCDARATIVVTYTFPDDPELSPFVTINKTYCAAHEPAD